MALRSPSLLLILALSTSALGTSASAFTTTTGETTGDWPFGTPEPGRGRARDLYNLGLLGAKASDAIRGEPVGGTGRRQVQGSEAGDDAGPSELRIELLFPDGPADRAGLQPGDVLVGVGRKRFEDGALAPLAEEIVDAWSAKKSETLTLRVRREENGESEDLELELEVEPKGRWFRDPTDADARMRLGNAALSWLAEHQLESGGFPETLSGTNGAVVQTCVAGLAWIAGGSSLAAGAHSDELARARTFVEENLDGLAGRAPTGGANWNQENWGWVHAGIFLGELHHAAPDEKLVATLQRIVDTVQANQESSGGMAHGPGGANALGYTELNIVGGMALCALGLAQSAGCELDEEKLERMIAYLDASTGDGLGYSTRDGQSGMGNIGRTAAAWLGLRTLGRGRGKLAKSYGGYVKRHADDVLAGHASLMQHIFFAGLAAEAHGSAAKKRYWAGLERDLVLALSPDGSLQPRPWHESLSLASNSDASLGEIWTTASWACVLLADLETGDSSGLPGLLGD